MDLTIYLHFSGAKTAAGVNFPLEIHRKVRYNSKAPAGVMELVDVVDSKSTAGDSVPVRVRPPAPYRVFITNLRVG